MGGCYSLALGLRLAALGWAGGTPAVPVGSDNLREEFGEGDALFEGVAKWGLGVDLVAISAAVSLAGDDFGLLELGDDALDGSLGDANLGGDVPEARFGVP